MDKYKPVSKEVFSAISSAGIIHHDNKNAYNLCEDCGTAMIMDSQRGTYTCNECNLEQDIIGGIDDCDPGSSSVVKMVGGKSVIRHRYGADNAKQIGDGYYKKLLELNNLYVEHCVEEALKIERNHREELRRKNCSCGAYIKRKSRKETISEDARNACDTENVREADEDAIAREEHETDKAYDACNASNTIIANNASITSNTSNTSNIEPPLECTCVFSSSSAEESRQSDEQIAMAVAKTSRVPEEILGAVAKTYADVFMFSKKKEYNEQGILLEVRDQRNRGKKLWAFIAYLLIQECAKQKHPMEDAQAVQFVKPKQGEVSIATGDRIARDYQLAGYLELPQINFAKGSENIIKDMRVLGLDEANFERFTGFVCDIMKTVSNEGVGIKAVEKTQRIGAIYIIIKQLGLKISPEIISEKCKIQSKTFMNFANEILDNKIIFHNVFRRYNIPDGIEGLVIRRKKR